MSIEEIQQRYRFSTPIDAFRQARRYIVNNALRRRQKTLNLSGFGLVELPPEIGQLSSLRELDLSNNQLAVLPPEIVGLTSLETLSLNLNKFVTLPDELNALGRLNSLSVRANKLVTLPPAVSKLSELRFLDLTNNVIERLPPEVGGLAALINLNLSGNTLSALPRELATCRRLVDLDISSNQLTKIPDVIFDLVSLTDLDISDNPITDIPAEITKLTELDRLFANRCAFTEFPASLLNFPTLRVLFMSGNQLRSIPPAIEQMRGLQRLMLQANQLSAIPPNISKLNLSILRLSENELSVLPNELGQMRSLEEAAKNDYEPLTEGLHLEQNPLDEPYPKLIAHGQPSATVNVLSYLRGELDPATIEAINVDESQDSSRPLEPPPEAGPNFQIAAGRLDLVAHDDLGSFDQATQLSLHQRLRRRSGLLRDATNKVSNQHPQLANIVSEYVDLISSELPHLDVTELWAAGNALMAAAVSFERQDRAKTLAEPLEPDHMGLLMEVAGLHGAFILGFSKARELTDRADQAKFDVETIRSISVPTSNILSALSRQRRLLSDRARNLIEALDSALLPGAWDISRIGYTSYATVRNALVVIGRIAIWINDKGGSLAGGTVVYAAITASGLPPETLQQVMTFLQANSSQILSFAAPFPELRVYLSWIIDFFDGQKEKPQEDK